MTNDIKQLVSTCPDCIHVHPSQPANPMVTSSPSSHFGFPMQHFGLDLFSFGGRDYLICVDHYQPSINFCDLSLRTLSSKFLLPGSTFSVGHSPSVVTGAHSFMGIFPVSVKNMASITNSQLLITRRVMASLKLVYVCMYRGRPSWRCPWDRVFQLGQGEGPIGLMGPISQPRGTIGTASLTLDHTCALICAF